MEVWSSVHSWRLERCARKSKTVLRCGVLTPPARSFSTLWTRGKKHFSEVFFVGGCPWRLSLYPKCASWRACEPSRSRPRAPRSQQPRQQPVGMPHAHPAARRGNTAVKGSREHVALYLEAADAASAPVGWKRYVDFRLGVVTQLVRAAGSALRRRAAGGCGRSFVPDSSPCRPTAQPAEGPDRASVWRSGAHEFNSETSDGTWGFSQARRGAWQLCRP